MKNLLGVHVGVISKGCAMSLQKLNIKKKEKKNHF